ncbi:ABC transporter permease [Halobacterium sp. KA-6]|uniref:ABC transporter permease n=1 Tax=Halobacterium sp. KA-6 TaxID=2896368 RepID=UPI001E365632|nr:ABC transporter permease [Halobacterium sp. KA-6]MCD2204058.1 ABC transporter permease [Halobacterium sp. KA-6]
MASRLEFIVKRLAMMVLTLFSIATVLFLLFRLMPGNPAAAVANPSMPPGVREQLLEQYGLDEPLTVQYALFMKNLVMGDLGVSFSRQQPVTGLLIGKALNTMVLMLSSLLIAFIIGPALGALFAWKRGSTLDTVGVGTVLTMYAAPVFWTGMLGIMVFSFRLGWLPSGGMHSPGFIAYSIWDQYFSVDFLRHLILPLTVTTLWWLTMPTFIMRNNMLDVMNEDFIEMNRAEGLSEFRIMYRHAARNALLPVLHYGATAVGLAMGTSVIIEKVFSWPGLGRMLWKAVIASDYPLAQGGFLAIATIIVVMNFLIDVLSVYIDPRLSEGDI